MSADWISADGDAEALQLMRDRVDGTRFELWERKRLVARSENKN